MATQEIARHDWEAFLTDLSKSHELKSVSAQFFGPATGNHQEARHLPFAGFEVQSQSGHVESIVLMLGTDPHDHISHTVTAPTQIWHKFGPEEADETVELRSADDITLILRFA